MMIPDKDGFYRVDDGGLIKGNLAVDGHMEDMVGGFDDKWIEGDVIAAARRRIALQNKLDSEIDWEIKDEE